MPVRTCVGCRRTAPAAELVRVVRRPDGTLVEGRTQPGRGAWLCAGSPECIDLAVRRRAFSKAFRAPVSDGAAERLRTYLGERARIEVCSEEVAHDAAVQDRGGNERTEVALGEEDPGL